MKDKIFFLHSPKTGGGSFRGILDDLYEDTLEIKVNLDPSVANRHMLGKTPVQYGHHPFNYVKHLKYNLGYDIITFIRHPVERIISHYYYVQEYGVVGEVLPGESLINFAIRRPREQVIFLGKDLNEYAFVGITEDFKNEVQRFARLADKPNLDYSSYERRNVCSIKKPVSKEDKVVIASFCKEEMALYNKALELRIKQGV